VDELSVICEEAFVPAGVKHQAGWRMFQVRGPVAFSETGVLASLAMPLAEAGISLFTVSTFDTDYLLVPADNVEAALAALERAGHRIFRGKDA
jgi:hypothetical protein